MAQITLNSSGVASSGSLLLQTNGTTTQATVDTSGNLGLGVTPLNAYTGSGFKAYELPKANIYSFDLGSRPIAGFSVNSYLNSSAVAKYIATGYATLYESDQGQHRFYTAASGTAGNAITFTQAMTLDASGNLILNDTSRIGSARLSLAVNASTENMLAFKTTTNGEISALRGLNSSGSEVVALNYDTTNSAMLFRTGSTERARIDSSGNLLVGATSISGLGGGSHNFVGKSANDYSVAFNSTFASGSQNYGIAVKYTAATPNSAGSEFLYCADATTFRAIIRSNGGLANYSANNVNLSDRREKINFAPAGNYLAKICAIPVQTFNYIDQNLEEDDGLTLGVVAQDVQAVAPELVMESNWGTKDDPKMRLSIYQTDLQYALMKCIQEQQAIITALTARIEALEQA